jgi:hypothetical protein
MHVARTTRQLRPFPAYAAAAFSISLPAAAGPFKPLKVSLFFRLELVGRAEKELDLSQ